MTNPQLAIYLRRIEEQLDLAIRIARQELAAIDANTKGETNIVDKTQDGFREKEDLPCIPALMPFEQLSVSIGKDIEQLTLE